MKHQWKLSGRCHIST